MKKISLIVFLLICVIAHSNAQQVNFDSLKRELAKRSATDTSRLSIIKTLDDAYTEYKPDSAIYYDKQLIEWATKHNDARLLADTRGGIAYSLYVKGDYAGALNIILLALPYIQTSKDAVFLANNYNLIGNIYKGQENYPKAISYYRLCLQTAVAAGDKADMSYAAFNLGQIFTQTNVRDSAMYYAKKAVIYDRANHGRYTDIVFNLWGNIYTKSKDYKKAIIYLQRSYTLATKTGDVRTQAISSVSRSNYYKQLNKTDSVIYWAKEGLRAAKIVSTNKIIYESADLLSLAYESKHQTDSAFKYLKLGSITKDSLYSTSKFQTIEAINAGETRRNAEITDARAAYQNNLRFYFMLFVIAVILLAVFFLWRNSRNQKRANEQLSEQKEKIRAQRDSLENTNRELEIGSALERVRSIAMGMQQPDDMLDICRGISDELEALGVNNIRNVQTAIIYESRGIYMNYEYYTLHKKTFITPVDYTHPIQAEFVKDMLVEGKYLKLTLEKTELAAWFEYQKTTNQFADPHLAEARSLHYHWYSIGPVALGISLYEHISQDDLTLFKRFLDVFRLAYRRYKDVELAIDQAKEANIEAGLERVRSRTMAMHNSKDVGDAMATVFDQVIKLGVDPTIRCGIGIIDKGTKHMEVWTAYAGEDEKVGLIVGDIDMTSHRMLQGVYENWTNSITHSSYLLEGEDQKDYYRAINNSHDYHARFKIGDLPGQQFQNAFYFPEGFIYVFSHKQLTTGAVAIFKRFAGVFGLTYRRFLDLQKAEAQTREAMIEAGLERVRSRTMAMQKSDELAQTAVVVFKQLISLGIQPNRLFIGIFHDDSGEIEFWATAEDGSKISNKFTGNINRNISVNKMYLGWKAHKKSIIIDMKGKELQDYFSYLGDELKVPFKLGRSQKRRVQLINYFSQGFIGMASPDPQPSETTNLMERFAGVFNLTYTRFNDLKIAEANALQATEDLVKLQTEKKRAEEALTDLKAAQTKLVQSEKMASLGELTAGIAHEIQNPLNFVNNFSDVSAELIDEMGEELDKGDLAEAKAIAADIKQNLEKIRHHGGRADSIVKGMLQHSRTSTGEKQLTNINVLVDEFFKLSYHGLRAKDKSFNAELITHFDENLPKINIAQQDIGRVLLNLFNNAFYAVNQKKKVKDDRYRPTVTVTTFAPPLTSGGWGVTVRDNGTGIPDAVKDKIMQPFFTTKPTGEGTGLGLSLTYDMVVKGHGGIITVESTEGEGSVFTITLPAG